MHKVIQDIGTAGIIAILRKQSRVFIDESLPRLVAAGLAVIEVSRTADEYATTLSSLVSKWRDELLIGAGTIRNEDDVEEAIGLGAQFLISPHFSPRLTELVVKREVPYIVGCYTPSEVAAALDIGPMAIKIFPAFLGGPKYIQALLAPFPGARLVPTGGVNPTDALEYWKAGAWAVAIGSEMSSVVGGNGWNDSQLKALFSGKPS